MSPNRNGSSHHLLSLLESLLTQPIEPTQSEVESAHGSAIAAIREVNERLANAHQLIAAGRRSEAIEIAEGPPHVLDEIAVLDSQLLRDWEHWSGQFGLPRFAPLRGDLASILNGAYTAENQLDHLLRRHRLLAIGRANLKQRIAVLSQLAAADPSNPQWNRLLAAYQRRRLEQLANRASQGCKHKDLRCLQLVMAELRQTQWLIPVSKTQVDFVQQQMVRLQSRESTNEAIVISEHLQDAFAAGDKTRMGLLVRRWREIEAHVDSEALAGVLPQVHSVIDWYDQDQNQLKQSQAQASALAQIEFIDDNASADDLLLVMKSITETGTVVPEDLRERYLGQLQRETRAKRLKAMLIVGTIATIIFLATSAAALAYHRKQAAAKLRREIFKIESALRLGNLASAENLLKESSLDSEQSKPFRDQIDRIKEKERRRVEEFDRDIGGIRGDLYIATEVADFEALSIRISEVAKTAKTRTDSDAVTELTDDAIARRVERLSEAIDQANQMMDEIREQLKTLGRKPDARATLSTWNARLQEKLADRWLRGESKLIMELSALKNDVLDRREAIFRMAQADKALSKITDAVGDWKAWESLVENPDPSVRDKFAAVADCLREEKELWVPIEDWNQVSSKWSLEQLLTATPELAPKIAADLKKVKDLKLSDLPAAADFIAASQVAAPIVQRGAGSIDFFVSALRSSEMSNIGSIEVRASKVSPSLWYYFAPGKDSFSEWGDGIRIKHFTDRKSKEVKTSSTIPFSFVRFPSDFQQSWRAYKSGERRMLAPHVRICKSLVALIEPLEANPKDWDQAFRSSLTGTLNARDLDPLIHFAIVKSLLEIGSQGSWVLTQEYAKHLEIVKSAELKGDENGMDPTDQEAAAAREIATKALNELRKLKRINPQPEIAKMKASLVIDTQYEPIGWLDQVDGRWLVRTPDGLAKSGTVCVRYKNTSGIDTARIGTLSGGKVNLRSNSSSAMRIGRPVWLESKGRARTEQGAR